MPKPTVTALDLTEQVLNSLEETRTEVVMLHPLLQLLADPAGETQDLSAANRLIGLLTDIQQGQADLLHQMAHMQADLTRRIEEVHALQKANAAQLARMAAYFP